MSQGRGPGFETTNWSLVLAARDEDPERARKALAQLCESYWPPLFAYARRRGHTPEKARDLTQEFFLQLLERRGLDAVHPSGGRLRSFLLTSMKNLMIDEGAHAAALKRGAGNRPLRLDVDTAVPEPAHDATPEAAFERQWALTVLRRALDRMREEAENKGDAARFEALKPFLIGDVETRPYDEIATDLGVTTDAVKMAVHRLRKRFGATLRATIADTVADSGDIEGEIRHLLQVLQE